MITVLGKVGLGFGTAVIIPAIPDAPTLSLSDPATGTSFIAAVTGSGTIRLYYRIFGEDTWTDGLTRSGDGNITQTGLAIGWYEVYATNTDGGPTSSPSTLETIRVTDGTDNALETALYVILTGDISVTAFIINRVYPVNLPQACIMPAITYQEIASTREYVMSGAIGMVSARYQINCWDDDYAGARALADAVRIALECYTGTVNGRSIYTVFLEDQGDLTVFPAGNEVLRRSGQRLDFTIWYKESLT